MPTAAQFERVMRDVEELLSSLRERAADVERVAGEHGFTGGALVKTIDDGIMAAGVAERRAVEAGDQLLTELERRRDICENHAAAVAAWQTAYDNADDVGREELGDRPSPPYPWVQI